MKQLSLLAICLLPSIAIKAQVTTPTNNTIPLLPQYVGWVGTTATVKPLDLKNGFNNQPINFFTNNSGTNGVANCTQKMIITPAGLVGIGNNLPIGFIPGARLHLHQTGGKVNLLFSNGTTGQTSNDGFEIEMEIPGGASFITHEIGAEFNWINDIPSAALYRTRMRLYDGGAGQDKGRLVLANDLPAIFTPEARLHISQVLEPLNQTNGNMFRSDGLQYTINQIQMFTGPNQDSLTEKLKLFIPASSASVGLQATDKDGYVFINTAGNKERFRVFNNTSSPSTPNGGGVAVHLDPSNPVAQPGSLLHIGEKFVVPITGLTGYFGWRNWMRVGTFDFTGSDNMYVGLKSEIVLEDPPGLPPISSDRQDAVINWGDNPVNPGNPSVGPDYLRFIHTQSYDAGALASFPKHKDGMEVARFAPNSNFGIGNFYNNPLFTTKDPVRRLEILSDKISETDNGTPQFRITHTQQGTVNTTTAGKFTDFHTNNNGDLAILTNDNTQTDTTDKTLKQRFVGINTNTPNNTLEINSQFVSATTPNGNGTATGWAGLRFTDLNSASVAQANLSNKVLSVDSTGDVILINNLNSPSLGNICNDSIQNPLTNNWQIPLNSKNFLFTDTVGSTGRVGIGAITNCAPGNLLEVKIGLTSNVSGLRLTDLATATPGTTSTKMLSVNSSGDVILVNTPVSGGGGTIANNGCSIGTGGNVVLGNDFNGTQATLLSDREIPLGGRRLLFSGSLSGNNQDRVFIGSINANGAPISGKFQSYHVGTIGVRSAINGITNGSNAGGQIIGVTGYSFNGLQDSYGVKGDASYAATNNVGVFGNANGIGTSTSYGIWGQAISDSSKNNYGGFFLANNASVNNYGLMAKTSASGSVINQGIYSEAQFGQTVYGVRTRAFGGATSTAVFGVHSLLSTTGSTYSSIAVYGKVGNPSSSYPANSIIGVYGAAVQSTGFAGFFDGKVWINGAANGAAGYPQTSDAIFKTNIDTINDALTIIKNLQPRTYFMDTTNAYGMNFNTERHYGFIAQEVETILPELVGSVTKPAMKDSSGAIITPELTFKTLDYNNLIALQTKAIQEQQNTINYLQLRDSIQDAQLAQLTSLMNSCCQNTSTRTQINSNNTVIDIELSDKDIIVLNQNVPNPFAEQTTIAYNVPEKSGFAQIIFNDMKGQIIKVVDIKTKGKGQLNVFANDLSTGMYTYSLYVDGKLIDTKKMVKTE